MEVFVTIGDKSGAVPVVKADISGLSDAMLVIDKSDWISIAVPNKTVDPSQTIEMQFGDGTRQSIYFDANGDWAGQSERV